MNKEEIYQGLRDAGYTEKQTEKLLASELTEEQYKQLIEAKAEKVNIDKKSGNLKFIKVNHSKRAEKFGRLSDGDTTKYMNITLKYFDNRCALSGEEFKSFKEGNVKNSKAKSNLSAEHVVALCQGGNDVYPNLVPTVLQYNISKNGYYLLDWWNKQKNSDETQTLYSPYRLLKLVNYMMKSLDARKKDLGLKQYEKLILTPNEIDEFLDGIEQQDKQETDNSKRKLISDVITTVEIDEEDEKKILQTIPGMEGNIPKQSEQQREKDDDTMMDIFLYDSIEMLKGDEELIGHEEFEQLMNCLDESYEKARGVIPFEIEVRNKILNKLEELGIEENKYTVANELLQNTEIFKITRDNKEGIEEYLSQYFEEKEKQLVTELELTDEQIQIAIANIPGILYDKSVAEDIKLYKKYVKGEVNIEIIDRVYLKNILKIKHWMENNNTTKPPRGQNKTVPEEEAKLGQALSEIRRRLIKPYAELKTEEEKEEYKGKHPELEEVMAIIEEIDRNNIPTNLQNILKIKQWMKDNNMTTPPRAQNENVPEEEGKLGRALSDIRRLLIKPYTELKTEEEKEEYKRNHPELEEIMAIIEEIDKNNIPTNLQNILKIKEWMEDNNMTTPPRAQNENVPEEEGKLGNALSNIRFNLIKPYTELKTEEEKEEYKGEYPELEEVMAIIEEIDRNNIPTNLQNVLKIKQWMKNNNTTIPPRAQNKRKTVPEEEAKLGKTLSYIRGQLIKPYTELKTEEEKEEYKRKYTELEEVMAIIEEIDRNNIPTNLRNVSNIKQWMKKNNTTIPPRQQNRKKTVPNEEAKLGQALSNIRSELIKPYTELKTEEEKEEYKSKHPELEEVMTIIEEIDRNNISIYLNNALNIKDWMGKNNTTIPPRQQNEKKNVPEKEAKLGQALSEIRRRLITPYTELETKEEKEKYKSKHPELEEVMTIIEEIDRNNIPIYLQNVLEIKQWMENNNTTIPPRAQNKKKTVPEEEAKFGGNLARIRSKLIKPYLEAQSEEKKEEYKRKHPELEEVMAIVNKIDKNKITRKDLKSVVVEQKRAGKIEENREIDKIYAEDFKHAEYSIEKESGDR